MLRDPAASIDATVGDDGLACVGPGIGGNPDLLAGERLASALAALQTRYDFLIISCPPLPQYGDAVAIAPRVDASILVITAGVSGRDEAIQARDALERVGSRILGIVMVERPRRWF